MSQSRGRQRRGDYRIFVGAFLEGDLAEQIQAVREQYDAQTAGITAPHVTLAGTYWRTGPATPENESVLINRLQAQQHRMAPFQIVLGGIRRFGNRAVYLGVKPDEGLLAARATLLQIIGRDKHRRYTPHLTLAMRLSPPEMDDMVNDLQQTAWETERWTVPVTQLHLMQRGPDDPAWRPIAAFSLAS